MNYSLTTISKLAAILAIAGFAQSALAAPPSGKNPKGGGTGEDLPVTDPVYSWMHPDISAAWNDGYTGQGVSITVIDDFSSSDFLTGRVQDIDGDKQEDIQSFTHGGWTALQASLVAPGATMYEQDFTARGAVKLRSGFNVLSLSYGMLTTAGYSVDQIRWGRREQSIVDAASAGTALVSKSAGNTWGLAVGEPFVDGNGNTLQDYLALDLIGTPSTIFVGALVDNPDSVSTGVMASYSTIAGSNPLVQAQFLVVGVEAGGTISDEFANYGASCGSTLGTCLYGTSFAAPIVSGYAAIVSSKFPGATPTQVANQLLQTAREDTIFGYNSSVHGQGEASLSRALAPISIN